MYKCKRMNYFFVYEPLKCFFTISIVNKTLYAPSELTILSTTTRLSNDVVNFFFTPLVYDVCLTAL
jgi:hypothetical protein